MRGVEALLGVLLEAVADDPLEAGRDVLVGDGEIRRVFLQDRRHRVGRRVAVEGALAREHLVEDRAEGEDVAARVGGPAADLLGRHVAERAHDDAGLRGGGRGREIGGLAPLLGVRQLGEAEVEDLHPAVVGDEEVLGLQVPVDDPLLVRGGEAVDDLERVVDRLARRERAAREDRAQRLAFEELLDDVGRAVVLADVVDGGDVGVVQDAGGLGLLLEAAQAVGVGGEGGGEDLDRHVAAEARVLRAVHLSHPARADGGEDLVGAEPGAGCQGHRGGGILVWCGCRASALTNIAISVIIPPVMERRWLTTN